jgi:glycosyltransferase involved in cell wall biosynthesis
LKYSILQTCVPAYRRPLFDLVAAELGPGFEVVAGDRFFDPSVRTEAAGCAWYRPCTNRFLADDHFLWQTGKSLSRLGDGPLVLEGNPRCLRSWLILLQSRSRGIRTAVWGHALGRAAGASRMSPSRRLMFSLATSVISYCYNERETLKRIFPGKEILVAGNSTVHKRECLPLSTAARERSAVLFVGRLVPAKKPMLLLEALKQLQEVGQGIGAVFVGDGPEREECEDFTRSAGLQNVRFAGAVYDRQRLRELAEPCFAMASSGYVGLSALDALSCGLPVIFSETEPNAPEVETLKTGNNALAFAEDSPNDLARALLEVYTNRERWLARAATNCTLVANRYSLENMAQQFCRFFRA